MLFSNEKINEIFLPENMNYFLVLFLKHYIIRSSSETQIPLKKKKRETKGNRETSNISNLLFSDIYVLVYAS